MQDDRARTAGREPHADDAAHGVGRRRDPGTSLEGRLAARPESVTEIRRAIRDFARKRGLDQRVLDRVALAVTEAAANAVLHAYDEEDTGEVQFAARLDESESELEVVIVDEGGGLREGYESPGIGWGLRLIEDCSTDYELRIRQPTGVELWMRFALPAEPLDDRAST